MKQQRNGVQHPGAPGSPLRLVRIIGESIARDLALGLFPAAMQVNASEFIESFDERLPQRADLPQPVDGFVIDARPGTVFFQQGEGRVEGWSCRHTRLETRRRSSVTGYGGLSRRGIETGLEIWPILKRRGTYRNSASWEFTGNQLVD
jgi:hypothetical protein